MRLIGGGEEKMTKYYYDDPLAAAWMSKHFGMRFQVKHAFSDAMIDIARVDPGVERPYYIHPDSAYLLEPVFGDVIYNGDRYYELDWQMDRQYIAAHFFGVDLSGNPLPDIWGVSRVIIRQGIPFIWPKSDPK